LSSIWDREKERKQASEGQSKLADDEKEREKREARRWSSETSHSDIYYMYRMKTRLEQLPGEPREKALEKFRLVFPEVAARAEEFYKMAQENPWTCAEILAMFKDRLFWEAAP
jgi:hypothetical protein